MKKIGLTLTYVLLSGCAAVTSHQDFSERRASLNDTEVCKTLIYSHEQSLNGNGSAFYQSATDEAGNRGYDLNSCKEKIKKQNIVAASVAIASVLAIAASSRRSSGGYAPTSVAQDYEWDWDEFYNEYRQLVWMCRGVQTGQFSPSEKCQYKFKTDSRWPSK